MHIFRFFSSQGARLGLEVDGKRYDLSATAPEFADLSRWLSLPDPVAAIYDAESRARDFPLTETLSLLAPLDTQEVWASGVTYLRSKVARMEESEQGGDFYDLVYEAERPELFLKATPARVVGPGEPIRVRRDSVWTARRRRRIRQRRMRQRICSSERSPRPSPRPRSRSQRSRAPPRGPGWLTFGGGT